MSRDDSPTVRERIGDLSQRLAQRLGRAYDNCRTCDRPTRSHQVGGGVQCHRCYTGNQPVAITDGGTPNTNTNATIKDVATVVDQLEDAPVALDVEATLCDVVAVSRQRAHELVRDALDVGAIEEYETDQGYAALRANSSDTTGEDAETSDTTPTLEAGETVSTPTVASVESWFEVDFQNTNSQTWAPAQMDRAQWMCRTEGKAPYAPWADSDAPVECNHSDHEANLTCRDCDHHAGYKWGSDGSQEHVHADFETAREWAEKHPDLAPELAFIQRDTDPFLFVDGDDVRDPETEEVHPEFVSLLEQLGISYADISLSASGVHAVYEGDIPLDGVPQAQFAIDTEPFGANEDVPEVEIYPNKHVCIATGEHVPGSGTEINPVDTDALRDILERNGFEDSEAISASAETSEFEDREAISASADIDLSNHTPDATTSGETTDDMKDVLAALDRLDAQRVAGDTIVHRWNDAANTSGKNRAFVPTWGTDANGTANIVDEEIWQDTGGNGYGGVDVMAAIDCPDLPSYDENTQPRELTGADWFRALDHLRELGYEIPELETNYAGEGEFTSYLPAAVRNLAERKTSGWDWQHTAAQSDATISIDDARQRTTDAITDAYESSDRVLIEALPTMGKSYGCIKAAAESGQAAIKAAGESGQQITVLTGRGNKEQYEQFREWCEKHDLDYYTLPAFNRDCHTASGEFGDDWQRKVMDWYRRGATPQTIHKFAEDTLGRPLPCQAHDGQSCPYAGQWDFNPDDYDVLIGHYAHGHKAKVTQSRTVVFDEFPGDSFENSFGTTGILPGAVSSWLTRTEEVPFDSYVDLLEHRDDEHRREAAEEYFDETGTERDELAVLEDSTSHALAPSLVYALLMTDDLGNGIERADIRDGGQKAVFNRNINELSLLTPPDLDYTSGIVALDGTPTLEMWEDCLGVRLNHREVLQGDERAEYIKQALNLNLIRTSEYIKPYNSAGHVNVEADATLLNEIAEMHDENPGVITTSTAEDQYRSAEQSLPIDKTKHYGNVLGSNEFKTKRVGAVIGSNHYGDHYVKKWAAYAGEVAERGEGKGADLDYGEYGNNVLQHMQQNDTLQAAMRFGRDGNGAVVYVHTDTLPDWVPLSGEGRVVKTWSDGMRSVIDALERLDSPTTNDIVEYPTVDVSRQQVFEHCETLREKGVLSRETNPDDRRGYVWIGDDLHRVGEHGNAELPSIELDELGDDDVRQLARSTLYTSNLTNFDQNKSEGEAATMMSTQSAPAASIEAVDTGEPPG